MDIRLQSLDLQFKVFLRRQSDLALAPHVVEVTTQRRVIFHKYVRLLCLFGELPPQGFDIFGGC